MPSSVVLAGGAEGKLETFSELPKLLDTCSASPTSPHSTSSHPPVFVRRPLTLWPSSSQLKLVDDVVYEADCAMIVMRDGEVDIGANA